MRALSFRSKLLLAMMLVVVGGTGATVLVTQRSVDASYRTLSRQQFETEVTLLAALEDARLATVKSTCLDLARSKRLRAALEAALDESALDVLYLTAWNELRNVLRPGPEDATGPLATFFRITTADGKVLSPPATRAVLPGGPAAGPWEAQVAAAGGALSTRDEQQVGYLAPEIDGRPRLHEVVLTRVLHPGKDAVLGALALGFPIDDLGADTHASAIRSGIWLGDRLYAPAIPAPLGTRIGDVLARALPAPRAAATRGSASDGEFTVDLDGVPQRVFYRALHATSGLPPAYHVGVYSLAESLARQHELRARILTFGAVFLLLALATSVLLARGLSVPIAELAAATGEVQSGNLAVRVPVRGRSELGRLAASFNAMTEGLALKEKYRGVLDVVADKDVTELLLEGELALGGELRQVSILFCDIRGFTARTEHMPPREVIDFLNEHMTALTRVVHEHHGIVDKFVGDALMAIFGAPRAGADDPEHAVRAAWAMIAARARLNAGRADGLAIGIGIATGQVVAGCMGSLTRLNYTVVGERVNLAARLCATAGPMEVLIDDETQRHVAGLVRVEPLPAVSLKGFATALRTYRLTGVGPLASAS
jgi:class 3 adenylate cyclase